MRVLNHLFAACAIKRSLSAAISQHTSAFIQDPDRTLAMCVARALVSLAVSTSTKSFIRTRDATSVIFATLHFVTLAVWIGTDVMFILLLPESLPSHLWISFVSFLQYGGWVDLCLNVEALHLDLSAWPCHSGWAREWLLLPPWKIVYAE